jgi:hypothetical protein
MPATLADELERLQIYCSAGNKAQQSATKGNIIFEEPRRAGILDGVGEGSRNDTAAKLAGGYIRRGLSDAEVLALLNDWNERNRPPLPERELRETIASIRKTDARKAPPAAAEECYLEQLTEADEDSDEDYEWLIDKLVPKGEPMIIGGKGSSGKSTLALEFAARIMEEDPAAGVVYICAEGTYRDTKIKARKMGITTLGRFFFLKRKNGGTAFKLSEQEDLPLVTKALESAQAAGHKIVFVVIDSIRGMHRGNMNEDSVGEVMQTVNGEICGRLGITVCYIHHARKNTKDMLAMDLFLGSVSIVNAIRYGLFMVKKTNQLREVEVAKSNLGNDDIYFRADMGENHRVQLNYAGTRGDEDGADLTRVDRAEELMLAMIGRGEEVMAVDIYKRGEAEGITSKTMREAKRLRGVDAFQRNHKWYWRLPREALKR